MKRYTYIIIGIVVIAIIAIGILFFIKTTSSNNTPANGTGSTTTNGGTLPSTGTQGTNSGTGTSTGGFGATDGTPIALPNPGGQGGTTGSNAPASTFGVLSNNPVADYFVDANNNIVAIQPDGQVFTVSNGQSKIVNSSTTANIFAAKFSFDGKKAVISYGDPNAPSTALYDAGTNVWTALPASMLSPVWSPSNYQLAFLSVSKTGKDVLSTIDVTSAASIKKGSATVLSLAASDLTVQWPIAGVFMLADKPSASAAGSIWSYTTKTGVLFPLVYEVAGAEAIWSNDQSSEYGLVFNGGVNGLNQTLQLQSISGHAPLENISLLSLPTKCGFSEAYDPITATTTTTSVAPTSTATSTKSGSKTVTPPPAPTSTPYLALFCGIPRTSSGFSSAHLPDDYNTMSLFTSDDLYRVNTANGDVTSLWSDGNQNMDASDVKVSNGTLFFVNRYDNKLYGLTSVIY